MKKILIYILVAIGYVLPVWGQNNSLVLNGAYLVLNGGTQTSTIQLVINQSSTNGIVRTSGHIVSESQYNYINWNSSTGSGNYIFPFGYSTSDYIPFTLTKTSTNSTSLKVSTWASATDNTPWAGTSLVAAVTSMTGMSGAEASNSVIDRWWDVNAANGTTADFIFSYRGSENTTTLDPTGTFQAQHWTGADWASPVGSGTGVTSGIGTVSVMGSTDFTPWVLSSYLYALPLELISFNAVLSQNKVELQWQATTHSGNDYFIIERSSDGYEFDSIGYLSSGNNQTGIRYYSFTDTDILAGKSFYRLRIIGEKGTVNYSEIKSVFSDTDFGVSVFPNPFEGALTIQLTDLTEEVTVTIRSSDGMILFSKELKSLTNTISRDFSELTNGIYFLTVENNKKNQVFKIIKI